MHLIYGIRNCRMLLIFLILFNSTTGKSVKMESMSIELGNIVKEIWCNGVNYTELCEGWRDLIECYGNVMQAEVWSVKDNTDLYAYSPTSIGNMLLGVACEQGGTVQAAGTDETRMNVYYWLVPLVCLLLLVGTIGFVCVRSYKKCGFFNFGNNNEMPETLATKTSNKV